MFPMDISEMVIRQSLTTPYNIISRSLLIVFLLSVVTISILIFFYISKDILFPPQFNYNCSLPLPQAICPSFVIQKDLPESFSSKFFTTNTVSPLSSSSQSIPQTQPLTYYYGHPTSIFDDHLYSYPFIITSKYESSSANIVLSSYTFEDSSVKTFSSPFDQYSFVTKTNPNRGKIIFPDLTTSRFEKNINNGTLANRPNLTTRLTSDDISLYLAEGCPYITIQPDVMVTSLNLIIASSYILPDTNNIIVNSNKTYTYYIYWDSPSKLYGTVLIFDSVISHSTTGLTIQFNNFQLPIYVTLVQSVGALESISTVLSEFVRYLNPPIISVKDISVGGALLETFIEYETVCQTNSYGFMWIIPNSVFKVNGLKTFQNTTTAFGFPTGRGLYVTDSPSAPSSSIVSFYTVWDHVVIPPDFSYRLSYDHLAVRDHQDGGGISLTTANDMYELSISLRVRADNERTVNPSQISACITYWIEELTNLQYDGDYNVLYTNNLGTELGIISKFAYILLTYINLFNIAISGILPTSSSPYLMIMNPSTKRRVEEIINVSLTTNYPVIGSPYTAIPYFDFYNSTFVSISTDTTPLIKYYSRFGEALGYIWACNYIIRNILLLPGSPAALLSGSLLDIIVQSTMALVKSDCSWISVSDHLPWNGLYSNNRIGFQLDPKALITLGNSPDSVFIESALPFSPISQAIVRPVQLHLRTAFHKMLRCSFPVESNNNSIYSFGNNKIDPVWTYFALYLFDDRDDSELFITGDIVPSHLTNFVSSSNARYRLVALLMNARKTPKVNNFVIET